MRVAFWLFVVGAAVRLLVTGGRTVLTLVGHGGVHAGRAGVTGAVFGLSLSVVFTVLTIVVGARLRRGSRVARVVLVVVVVFSFLGALGPDSWLLVLPAMVSAGGVVASCTRSANAYFRSD